MTGLSHEEFRDLFPWWGEPPSTARLDYDAPFAAGEAALFTVPRQPGFRAALRYAVFGRPGRLAGFTPTTPPQPPPAGPVHHSREPAGLAFLSGAGGGPFEWEPRRGDLCLYYLLTGARADGGVPFRKVTPGAPGWAEFAARVREATERYAAETRDRAREYARVADAVTAREAAAAATVAAAPVWPDLPGLREAADLFAATRPEYATPSGARGKSGRAAYDFADLLVAARVLARWPDAAGTPSAVRDWDLETVHEGGEVRTVVRIGRVLIDWAARELSPAADWPRVWSVPATPPAALAG